MDLEDLDPEAALLAREIAYALRRLDAAKHATADVRVPALIQAMDTRARVRRILSWTKLDRLHETDILARLQELSDRIHALRTKPQNEP